MQWLFRILTLIALVASPIAAPASAQPVAAECKPMDMGASQHQMPASHHRTGEPCCIAVPPAITPPLAAVHVVQMLDHPAFIVVTEPFRLGAGPKAEDPPPRAA